MVATWFAVPFSIKASWTSLASFRMIMVRVPILRVKMGPYFSWRSSAYWKNGFPKQANWKRLPTISHLGGPGGRLGCLDLDLWVSRKIKPEMRNARGRWIVQVS
ncbi:hypothetical protein FF1_000042 [Malus domestica]